MSSLLNYTNYLDGNLRNYIAPPAIIKKLRLSRGTDTTYVQPMLHRAYLYDVDSRWSIGHAFIEMNKVR